MSGYQEQSVHAYFARPTNLILVAVGAVSLLFVALILLGRPPSSVTRPGVGLTLFGLTAAAAAAGLARSPRRFGFSFIRDGLPFLLLPVAMWGAGNDSSGPPVMLAIGVLTVSFFWWGDGRRDVIKEHHHLTWLKFRWPF